MSSTEPESPSRLRWAVVPLVALGVVALFLALRSPAPRSPPSFEVIVRVTPPGARIELDGRPVGVGAWRATLPRDGRAHQLQLGAAGHHPQRIYFTDAPPPATVTLQPL